MSSGKKIDLAYFYDPLSAGSISWELGEKRALDLPLQHLAFTVHCLLAQTTSDWILFWDFALGEPDLDLVQDLSERPVDVWHAGIRLGLGGLPKVLNYVDPVWMYNCDASPEVTHTSFRMSMRACLIRTDILRKTGGINAGYESLDMTGIAMGYSILKQGGIIRYHSQLVKSDYDDDIDIPEKDEWVFARQFFTKKWQLWSLFNHPATRKAFKIWSQLKHIKPLLLKPHLHPSAKQGVQQLPHTTVSVLVPTLDRYSYLINELEQLDKQTVLPLEVLITDQTDKDKRVNIDFSNYKKLSIRYFPQDEKGQVVAWNKLLEEAKGDFVLFLGDDADGITPDFIEKLLLTQQRFDCDMVASNVTELGITYTKSDPYYHISDVFPITLIKRSVLLQTGFMNMFFNRNIRADGELAMRCHLNGTLMIFDSSATIYHHRAPMGGLRAHKARVITNYISKNSISKFSLPTSSEIYLVKKYFKDEQYRNNMRIKYMSQLAVNGGIIRKIMRAIVLLVKLPYIRKTHKANVLAAYKAANGE
ncbi:MAG: glycosyltransferase family 2 protein [Sphingobacteriales bacterium]|nr:MAG: glycosyltransferase family 2 protein [Sphingobacteriales bacterium]